MLRTKRIKPICGWLLALGLLAAAACVSTSASSVSEPTLAYTPPGYAIWDSSNSPKLSVNVVVTEASMSAPAQMQVTLVNRGGPLYVSNFLNTSRGIAWTVQSQGGKFLSSKEPLPISPPQPPPPPVPTRAALDVAKKRLILIAPGKPHTFSVRELPQWIYPGAGSWQLRAAVVLKNYNPFGAADPRNRVIRTFSDPVSVTVSP